MAIIIDKSEEGSAATFGALASHPVASPLQRGRVVEPYASFPLLFRRADAHVHRAQGKRILKGGPLAIDDEAAQVLL